LFKIFFFEAFVMSSVWDSSSIDFNVIKSDRSLSKFLKIVLNKNSKSKCCQKCIKFLIENFILKCVFDVSRVVCN
jgi:RNase P subunit RPR2